MAEVIAFPGVSPSSIRPRPFAGLVDGAKALVVIPEGDHYAVVMRPALTRAESDLRKSFPTVMAALRYAHGLTRSVPAIYHLVLDYSEWSAA